MPVTKKIDRPFDVATMPHVLLLIESSRAYGRGCLMGIASYMRAHGLWNVMHLERGLQEDVPTIVKGQRFDGVIARIENASIAKEVKKLKVPTVDLRGVFQPAGGVAFNTDPEACANLAFEHFRERGFRNVGFCGYRGVDFSDQRSDCFQQQCAANNLTPYIYPGAKVRSYSSKVRADNTLLREAAGEIQEIELIQWLHSLPKPIGIFACNDVRGRQVLAAARSADLRVPSQVAVLGVDDDEVICDLSNPPLSSIEPDTQRIGFEGAAMLARLMAGKSFDDAFVFVPPLRISVRQSSDVTAVDDPTVALALDFIQNNACHGIGVGEVTKAISVSRATLERRFREHLDRSPREEIERVRVARVRTLLAETDYSLDRIANMTSYATASHLLTAFRRVVNCTPGEYRRQVQGCR